MNRLETRIVLAGVALWSAIGVAAFAQDTTPPPQPPAETKPAEEAKPEETPKEEVFTEVITVTSMKREQELKDLPISVAAPTEELLRSHGADNMETLSANVAGFSVQNLGPGQSQIAMRGVSGGQIVRDQPGVKEQVGVYFDESAISLSLFTPDIDLFDVSRVEVLRGPQGTLFGSGSLGGTVRYISNQPVIGSEDKVAEVSIGSIDGGDVGGDAKAAINVPMGDKAAMRITAYYNALAGYTDAIQPGGGIDKDVNTGDRTGARVAFHFAPNDRLTITPRYFYQKVTGDGWNREDAFNILANQFTTSRPQVHIGEREVFTQIDEPFTDKFQLADVNVGYDFGGVLLTSVTSYIDRDVLVVRDATALTASVNGGTLGTAGFCPRCSAEDVFTIDAPLDDATQVQTWSEELRFSGKGTGRLNWVAGAFYSSTDKHYGQSLIVDGFEDRSGLTFSTTRPDFTYTVKDELYWSTLDYNLDQWAVFGEGTWAVSDTFNLTGGLRWYDFNEDKHQIFDGLFADFGGQINDNSTSADGLAPRLIASWAVTSLTRLNAQVSRGFRLGGVNDPILRDLCTPADLVAFGGFRNWDDETAWNYELGTKSSIMGGRGSFNVSAFYMDISDLQAVVTAGTCSSRIVVNVPQAHSAGLELELAAATSEHFDFSITASYDDSQLDSTVGSAASAAVSGLREGNRLPSVPKFQASAAATYQWTINQSWLGYLTGTYQHVGSRFTQFSDYAAGFGTINLTTFANDIGGPYTQNVITFNPELPAYDLFNLRFGMIIGSWDTAVYVNNVTDETALLALDRERGTLARVGFLTNQPRTFGISTRVHF